jgi:homoserine dehydrogenase
MEFGLMSEPLGIALVGCGTVGGGVADILLRHRDRLAARAGRPLSLRKVIVRDPNKPRDLPIPRELFTADHAAIHDPSVHVVVELIGGVTTAKKVVLDALAAGKHVVTANKALLADAGSEIFEAARRAERAVCFEAAVAGGVPIIRALGESLAANQVTAIQAILNGTSNFILTAMTERGMTYAAALAEAQKLGYAEADPTLDVDGSDAAHKLAVLAQIAFGVAARPHEIERKGIDTVEEDRYFALMLATNEGWAVPAGVDERRLMVLDVSSCHKEDKAFFKAVEHEWTRAGKEALFAFLSKRDISEFEYRERPVTRALIDQMTRSFTGAQRYVHNMLCNGEAPISAFRDGVARTIAIEGFRNFSLLVLHQT